MSLLLTICGAFIFGVSLSFPPFLPVRCTYSLVISLLNYHYYNDVLQLHEHAYILSPWVKPIAMVLLAYALLRICGWRPAPLLNFRAVFVVVYRWGCLSTIVDRALFFFFFWSNQDKKLSVSLSSHIFFVCVLVCALFFIFSIKDVSYETPCSVEPTYSTSEIPVT